MSRFAKTHSPVWADNIFKGKVVFCTGGAGTICSVQVAAMVRLGADAAIVGRRKGHTEDVAREIEGVRAGAKVCFDFLLGWVARKEGGVGKWAWGW
jgi:peroxisomal 2,4-dienoyl-CoA reductase